MRIDIEVSDRYRFLNLRQYHTGDWDATLACSFDLRDLQGSSLGGLVAAARAGTPQRAVEAALAKLETLIGEAMEKSRNPHKRPVLAAPTKSGGEAELLGLLGL